MREVRCMEKEERVVIKRVFIPLCVCMLIIGHVTALSVTRMYGGWKSNVRYVSNVRNGASEMSDVE